MLLSATCLHMSNRQLQLSDKYWYIMCAKNLKFAPNYFFKIGFRRPQILLLWTMIYGNTKLF